MKYMKASRLFVILRGLAEFPIFKLLKEHTEMVWTPWIDIAPLDTVDNEIRELYRRTGSEFPNGNPPDLVRLTSATPRISGLLFDLSRAIHNDANGLTTREQAMVALIVASLNGCVH